MEIYPARQHIALCMVEQENVSFINPTAVFDLFASYR